MNAVIMELTLTLYCGIIIIFIPCVEFKEALDELNKIQVELGDVKRKIKYGRLLLQNINVTQFKGKNRGCKCACGEGDGNKFKPNKYVVKSEEVPVGRIIGVTRGTTQYNRYAYNKNKKKKNKGPTKPTARPRSNFLSTAYKKLLENLGTKLYKDQPNYLTITHSYSDYYNRTMEAGRLDLLGFPFVLVQQKFAAELSNRDKVDYKTLREPTRLRLASFNYRNRQWNGEDIALLNEADSILERYPREGDRLLQLINEIIKFPIPGYDKTGEMLMKEIFDTFLKPWELMDPAEVEVFMDRVNKALKVHGYGNRRYLNVIDTMGRQNNIFKQWLISKQWEELRTAMDDLTAMANKIKYSKLLLKDMNIMNIESVEGCMCKKCPGAKGGDYMYMAEMEFTTDSPYGPLPNYYAYVNHGFLPVAFEMYMDAIAQLNPAKVKKVITHSLDVLNSKLLKGDLRWLGEPMLEVITSTAKVLTKMQIDELQIRAAVAVERIQNRYTYYSEYTNNILDYADTVLDYNQGKNLIETIQIFEAIDVRRPRRDITPKELCERIIVAFEMLFSGLVGTDDLDKLMWHTNTALRERYTKLKKLKPPPLLEG